MSRQKSGSKVSSVGRLVQQLSRDIELGKIVPGQRLITSEYAKEMGTSLAPVREAFHLLAGEGLLELLPNRGARVRKLSTQNLLEGVEILQAVAVLALKLASRKTLSKQDHLNLARVLEHIFEAGNRRDAHEFFRAVSSSYRWLNDLAGNSYLNPVVDRLHLEYFNNQLSTLIPGNWERYIENYMKMGRTIAAGEYEAAEQYINEHFDWVISLLREKIRQEQEREAL